MDWMRPNSNTRSKRCSPVNTTGKRFTRKSVVSPFLLKISDEGRDAGKVGRRVDLYFVAYGSLSKLGNDTFLQDHLNLTANDQGSESYQVKVLTDDELTHRGLPTGQKPDDQRWVAVESTLLGKVLISLTTQNAKTTTNDSILIASVADPRFENDVEHPNCWRSITTDDAGHRQIGSRSPTAA